MLFVLEGPGPFPAAVIIHGAGTRRRDNGWYLTLTRDLQSEGIVVLLPDKRGSEKSGGAWRTASLEDLATDTIAAVSFLQRQDNLALSRIGIIGLSQGEQVAPIAESQSNDIDFVVNVVGSGVPLRDQLLYEENHNLRQMGFLPGVSNLFAWFSSSYLVHVGQQDFWEAVGEFDPLPYCEKVTAPTLMLYGAEDTNVNSSKSAARIRGLAKPNMVVEVFKGSGHALEQPVNMGNQIFRPDARDRISQFVLEGG